MYKDIYIIHRNTIYKHTSHMHLHLACLARIHGIWSVSELTQQEERGPRHLKMIDVVRAPRPKPLEALEKPLERL